MITKAFYPNPVIKSMTFSNGILSITFARSGQIRKYEASNELAYGLFHCKNASDEVAYYSNKIKKLCNVADVVNAK